MLRTEQSLITKRMPKLSMGGFVYYQRMVKCGIDIEVTAYKLMCVCVRMEPVSSVYIAWQNQPQCKVDMSRDRTLERNFESRFPTINSSLLRLKFLSGFLLSFFRSKKC